MAQSHAPTGRRQNPTGALNLAWMNTAGGFLALDRRIWMFTDYYSVSPGMLSQIPGKGAKYAIAFTDSDRHAPVGRLRTIALNLPPNIPAANFWSVTLYDAENASGLANGQPFPSLGSRDKPAQNADGSTDLTSAPKPRKAKPATGSRPCRARDISPSSGSTARPKPPSTRVRSPATSKRSSDFCSAQRPRRVGRRPETGNSDHLRHFPGREAAFSASRIHFCPAPASSASSRRPRSTSWRMMPCGRGGGETRRRAGEIPLLLAIGPAPAWPQVERRDRQVELFLGHATLLAGKRSASADVGPPVSANGFPSSFFTSATSLRAATGQASG